MILPSGVNALGDVVSMIRSDLFSTTIRKACKTLIVNSFLELKQHSEVVLLHSDVGHICMPAPAG
jgi:hypothetical protein